jgi:hypothetical protein
MRGISESSQRRHRLLQMNVGRQGTINFEAEPPVGSEAHYFGRLGEVCI